MAYAEVALGQGFIVLLTLPKPEQHLMFFQKYDVPEREQRMKNFLLASLMIRFVSFRSFVYVIRFNGEPS